jgi:hypothetical protein
MLPLIPADMIVRMHFYYAIKANCWTIFSPPPRQCVPCCIWRKSLSHLVDIIALHSYPYQVPFVVGSADSFSVVVVCQQCASLSTEIKARATAQKSKKLKPISFYFAFLLRSAI